MTSLTLVIWNHEPVFESPARRNFNLNWSGNLIRADFTIDVDPNFWVLPLDKQFFIEKILLNGVEVTFTGDRNNVVTFNGKDIVRKGANYIEIYHNARPILGIQAAGVFAYVVLEAESVGGEIVFPPPSDGGLNVSLIILLALILIMLVVLVR